MLKLTNVDDEIYALFRESFKDMKIDVIDEDEMKSAEGKAVRHIRNHSDFTRPVVDIERI